MVRQPPRPHRRLVVGVNDPSLTQGWAQPTAQGLGLDQYALPLQWKPGQKVTGSEFGSLSPNQKLLVYLYGNAKDAPRNNQQRHAYANYASALVERYPNIRELQVWNEPTYPQFWKGKNPNLSYLPLLANTYDAVRKSGSKAKVLSPGAQPGVIQQLAFVNAVKHYYKGTGRKRPLFDAYASHPYWDYQKTGAIAKAMNRQWQGLPQTTPKRGLKFWWTETGMDAPLPGGAYEGAPAPDWRLSGTVDQQAKRVGTMLNLAERNPLIAGIFNFLLFDEKNRFGWQTGLVDPSGQRKPAYTALQQAIVSARTRGY